ncbi:hypothetical protein HK105_203685 [Polyrhizophydium stewartii]|uniref:SRP9 domain-containing protein n=1 Tax=Polyrhizophydium stewartii TaxID=2732419 RepID=A0ABR4NBT4_9FUNG
MRADTFHDFELAALALYAQAPLRTRYVAKYRHKDAKLVLKCIRYKTDKLQDLNKFERLNRALMAQMQQNPLDLNKAEHDKQELRDGAGAAAGAERSPKAAKKTKKRR